MSENYIIIHIFYYFLIWTSIIVPLAVFSIAYGRTENQWQAGAIVYGILTFAIWGLTKTQLVTMISFVLPASWLLNNMIFLLHLLLMLYLFASKQSQQPYWQC